uniref:Dystroglycan 1 n=1 Tax=Cacopsylla melanoneura TaxID=428564 RepID=A0A8D8VFS9_9HEMI
MSLPRALKPILLIATTLHLVTCDTPLRLGAGISDTSTYVGKLFHYPIPKDAFHGTNLHYKVEGQIKPLPSWLVFDERRNALEGVPTPQDVGDVYVLVKARDAEGAQVKDVFSVQVLPGSQLEPNSNEKRKCKPAENIAMLSLVIDKALNDIPPKDRVRSLTNLAGFLVLETSQLTMLPQKSQDAKSDRILDSGQVRGVKRKLAHTSTVIMWQVGCEGEIWSEMLSEVERTKHLARDGTLNEVLELPLIGWHIINNINPFRERRDIMNDESMDENSLDGDAEEEEGMTTTKSPSILRHRHRHGGSSDAGDNSSLIVGADGDAVVGSRPSSISLYESEPTSPLVPDQLVPELVTRRSHNSSESQGLTSPSVFTSPTDSDNELASSMQSSPTLPPDFGSSTLGGPMSSSSSSLDNLLPSLPSSGVNSPPPSTRSVPPSPSSTGAATSTLAATGETNHLPHLRTRLPKLPFTAGKPATFEIPANTFHDDEDGDTRHLKLSFKPTTPTSWIQFNKTKQEVYALPLEEHVSRWNYDVIASDKHAASVSDTLEIFVQHHRQYRSVTHEISLHIQMESLGTVKFESMVDWQIFVYNTLLDIYGNSGNQSYITVRSVVTNKEPYVFTWTNESLPRNECPSNEINSLLEVISNPSTGQVRPVLASALGRLMTVKNVTWRGVGHCEDSPDTSLVPTKPKYAENLPPLIRNPIDHLEATVGELLVFHVPEDTFFDREDGGTRKLRLHLKTMDRTTIPPNNWLQFDVKNQEFYGIPQLSDEGRKEYQLVCEDSGKSTANDGLEVIVSLPGPSYYSATFSLTLMKPVSHFDRPAVRRAFVEKLARLFGDRDAKNLVGIEFESLGVEGDQSVVRWANATLSSKVECPEATIGVLRQVLLSDEDILQETLISSLESDYEVVSASVKPTGICEGLKTPLHVPGVERKPAFNSKSTPVNTSVEYMITIVAPLVVIVTMLLCAAFIACLLYRRRHTGKMSVGNGVDSGILIRSKGIPVIFQDELEERLEVSSGTKSPIILKEEKPPLPPPDYKHDTFGKTNEYSRSHPNNDYKNDFSRSQPNATTALLSDIDDTSPYHPPPPIRPTPTYRQPPPYLPP